MKSSFEIDAEIVEIEQKTLLEGLRCPLTDWEFSRTVSQLTADVSRVIAPWTAVSGTQLLGSRGVSS